MFKKWLIFTAMCALFFSSSQRKIISYEYFLITGGYNILLSIGDPYQRIYFNLDFSSNFTWTISSLYYKNKSQFYKFNYDAYFLLHTDRREKFYAVEDRYELYRKDLISESFPFYVFDREFGEGPSSVSLAYSYKNYSFSLVHQLYNKKKIDKLAFGITSKILNGQDRKGFIYFGGFPEETSKGKPNLRRKNHRFTCKINKGYKSWGCNMKGILINNSTFIELYDYAMLTAKSEKILATNSFMSLMDDSIFKEYLTSEVCEYKMSEGRYKIIVCKCNNVQNFPKIEIVFEDNVFPISEHRMFTQDGNRCVFKIMKFADESRNDKWSLGYNFFEKFDTLFDYERGEISFYSESPFIVYYDRNRSLVMMIFICCICLNVLIIFWLLFVVLRRKK